MHCPFYLAIASFITNDGQHVWNEYADLNIEEVDINNKEEVLAVFRKNRMTECPKRLTVVRNNLQGGPKVIQDWG